MDSFGTTTVEPRYLAVRLQFILTIKALFLKDKQFIDNNEIKNVIKIRMRYKILKFRILT